MHRTITLALALPLIAGALSACQTGNANRAPTVVSSPERDQSMLGPVTSLAGEWQMVDEDGTVAPGSTFTVSSADSIVREVMFPGELHEMTNVYHMDGQDLVVTHYCAAGNQPRMVATTANVTDAGTVYEFNFDSVSNKRDDQEAVMGNLTLTISADGTLRQDWRTITPDGLSEPMTFVMQRKFKW